MRQGLARELGLQPSPVLMRLYESILVSDPDLELATPAARGPEAVHAAGPDRTRLTRDLTDFTGRQGEIEAVVGLLSDRPTGAVVAVTGPAGVGKTALAVHCAHRLRARFPDGRVLVGLRSPDGRARAVSDLLADLLRAVRPVDRPPDDPYERAALLREATAGRRMLFLLDDAVDEGQVRDVLFAIGETDVVVTSRRRLSGLEPAVRVAIDPLPDEDAWRLLAHLVGAGRLAAEPAASGRLVHICGGLPLLIRIIGTKLDGLAHLSLAGFLDSFSDERHVLDQLCVGDLGLRTRLADADTDLGAGDRAVLRRLALRPDPAFTVAEAAQQLGIGTAAAEATIERLLEAYLVDVDRADVEAHMSEVRYRVPWPIRALAREPRTVHNVR
jgi:hypothetical protein